MMTSLINKVYLQRQFENVDQLKLALEAEWNRLSQTFLLTKASMNGDNVLKLLLRTMEDILNIFSNNLNDFNCALIYHGTFCCMILLVFGYLCFAR